jgi:hypothetical protein
VEIGLPSVLRSVTKGLIGLQLAMTDTPFVLSSPGVAIALGIAAGILCLVASRFSAGVMRPGHPAMGMALTVFLLLARLVFSAAALGLYHALAPQGFTAFGCAYIGGFLVAYNYELLQFSGLWRRGSWQKGR